MDPQAKDGVHSDLRIDGDGQLISHETPVYDMMMEDARRYVQDYPDLYRDALRFYSETRSDDTRRDIIEGLVEIGSSQGLYVRLCRFL